MHSAVLDPQRTFWRINADVCERSGNRSFLPNVSGRGAGGFLVRRTPDQRSVGGEAAGFGPMIGDAGATEWRK